MREQKFRVLSSEELESMEKEFVDFLIINGIAAADWQIMKIDDTKQADEMVGIFSDLVFETMMRKTKYIAHSSSKHFICYDVMENEVNCINLIVKNESFNIDLSNIGNQLQAADVEEYDIVFATKKLKLDRSLFIYEETEKGFMISDGKLYRNLLTLAIK